MMKVITIKNNKCPMISWKDKQDKQKCVKFVFQQRKIQYLIFNKIILFYFFLFRYFIHM